MKFHSTDSEESSSLITDHCSLGTSAFSFRSYQREDLARSAIHDGAIIAWDPGLGKTMAIFAWPFIKGAQRTLIVAPASLHDQIIREGLEKFRVEVTPIPDQAAAYALMRSGHLPLPGSSLITDHCSLGTSLPSFFITDYRWLGYNGGDEWASGSDDSDVTDVVRRRRMAAIARILSMPGEAIDIATKAIARTTKPCPAYELLGVAPDAPRSEIKLAYRMIARLTHPDLHPDDETATARMQRLNHAVESMLKGDATTIIAGLSDEVADIKPTLHAMMQGIGTTKDYPATSTDHSTLFKGRDALLPNSSSSSSSSTDHCSLITDHSSSPSSSPSTAHSIRCLFTPTLSTLLADCFDCVVADEAVRLKSGTTYIASGVLGLNPKYRLALTGTPIKNRLPDIFFLASWVCGGSAEATARWPYGNTKAHQNSFATNHLVMEENLTKEEASRKTGMFRRYVKQTNKITNVHRLWKMLGPIVARRRKDSIGNDIVGKTLVPLKVMPGSDQQAVYKWHLDNPPECATPVAALGAQLQNLRMAALCPWSPNLQRPGCAGSKSTHATSPKLLAILHLAADLMEKGEQLVVFSPFQAFSTALKALLMEAGVPALLLDGRVKNTQRGPLAAQFKQGQYPVLIAGIDAMGEGHSFECASHLVIPSLSWAYDANRQAIERVHRLTSRKDVTIYLMVTSNSIDERLAAIFSEKGDASDLALDGRLFEEDEQEVSLGDLIRSATLDFDRHATTLPEASLTHEWNTTLRDRLATASKSFTMQRGTASAAAANPKSKITNPKSSIHPTMPKPPIHGAPDSSGLSFIHSSSSNQPSTLNPQPHPPTNIITFPAPAKPTRPRLSPAQIAQLAANFA